MRRHRPGRVRGERGAGEPRLREEGKRAGEPRAGAPNKDKGLQPIDPQYEYEKYPTDAHPSQATTTPDRRHGDQPQNVMHQRSPEQSNVERARDTLERHTARRDIDAVLRCLRKCNLEHEDAKRFARLHGIASPSDMSLIDHESATHLVDRFNKDWPERRIGGVVTPSSGPSSTWRIKAMRKGSRLSPTAS